MSRTRWIGNTFALWLLLCAVSAHAGVLVCGVVHSGGVAVKGANLVAIERGVTAVTDSAGSFCLDLDGPGTVTVRAIAIGFEPGERLVNVGADGATVRFELVPLRGASPGLTVSSAAGAVAATHDKLAPVAPSSAASSAGIEIVTQFPLLLTAADSSWLSEKHKGAQWDTLLVLHDALRGRGPFGSGTDPETWRKLGERLSDLKLRWCVSDAPRKRSLGPAPCAYLERGIALSDVRASALAKKGVSRNTKVYLQSLADSSDHTVSGWAQGLLDKLNVAMSTPPETHADTQR